MSRPLRLLIIDDSEPDSILIINELKNYGFNMSWMRVDTADALKHELHTKEWDIIICDYIMPMFSAMDAINIINKEKIDVPVIVMTGMLTDDIAPELIRAGASDFISKNEINRLSAAVERELKRTVAAVEEKITEEEKKIKTFSKPVYRKPLLNIAGRFAVVFGIISAVVISYTLIIAFKSAKDTEALIYAQVVAMSGSVASAISDFNTHDNGISGESLVKTQEYLKDLKNTLNYESAVILPGGGILAGFGSVANSIYKAGMGSSVDRVMEDGATMKIRLPSDNGHIAEVLLTRINKFSGPVEGVLAIDYSDYYSAVTELARVNAEIGLLIIAFSLIIIALAVYLAADSFIRPIREIKKATELISAGDLDTPVNIKSFDEMGEIALSFDGMRACLKENMEKLKAEISDRHLAEQALQSLHLKLTRWVSELDKRTHEITLMNQMGKMLQSCKNVEEFHQVTLRYAEQLFPDDHGAVYMFNDSGKFMEAVCMWGKEPIEHSFAPDECWSLRSGHLYTADSPDNPNMLCRHIRARGFDKSQVETICVPMMAQGETIGMFHIRSTPKPGDTATNIHSKRSFAREQLVGAVAEQITLALSNLKLQDSLRQQSILDPLTGLFNRRYMKDSLERELYRAKRHNIPFGVIMLDIDFFKKFNDSYGHDIGDMVLERIGKLIKSAVRPEDIACRYGGEEFLVILPGTTMEGTNQCAARILSESHNIKIKNKGVMLGGVTVSLGVAAFPANGVTIEQVVKAADNALLEAKNSGRDRIILSNETFPLADNQHLQ